MTSAKPETRWPHRALIFACAVAATLPLAIRGNSCGHDFDFHIQSWLAVASQWRHGPLYPHWMYGANYAAGEPRFVFYPPLSWMLGAFLGKVLPWTAAPAAFTLMILTACGFSMNKLAREWLSPNAATIAACAYILNPYALFVAYERTAYAELAAGIWLPLIVLHSLRKRTSASPLGAGADVPGLASGTWAFPNPSTIPLALSIAAIWFTNAPAAVMACYTLAAITIWTSISRKHWQPILQSTTSLTLGLGLASFYLVPAAYERRWVDISRAIDPGMRVEDSFLFGRTGQSFHDQVLQTASWIFVTMLAAIAISAWIAYLRKTARRLLLPIFVTAAVLLALQLPWSDPIWHLAPELKFLQFPWRWSLVLSIALAMTIGAALTQHSDSASPRSLRITGAAILIAAFALVSAGTYFFWQQCDEEDAVSAQVAVFKAGTGFEGTDEYTPIGADNSIIEQGLPDLRLLDTADAEIAVADANQDEGNPVYIPNDKDHLPIQARIERWLPEDKDLTLTTLSPGFAVLRLMDYPAWQVRANGNPVLNRPHRDDGLMTVPIPAGTTHIEITYAATPDLGWGRGLTGASLLALLALAVAAQRRKQLGYYD